MSIKMVEYVFDLQYFFVLFGMLIFLFLFTITTPPENPDESILQRNAGKLEIIFGSLFVAFFIGSMYKTRWSQGLIVTR